MKVLVTGAAGFIGFHLCGRIAEGGHDVVGIDSISNYYEPSLKYARLAELGVSRDAAMGAAPALSTKIPALQFRRLSIEDRPGMLGLFSEHRFELVVHLAAQAGVRYSLQNPHAYVDTNISGFLNVLEQCRTSHVKHLVFASSSSVYGLSRQVPFSEHAPTDHPVSLYAATKKSNEIMAHAYSHLYELPATGLRFFTVYGPWGRPDMAYFKFARAIRDGLPVELYNAGDVARDFTFIDDAVEAVVRVLARPPAPNKDWRAEDPDPASSAAPFRIYNIGSNVPHSVGALVGELERSLQKKAVRRMAAMQQGDVYRTEADISDISRDFGWKPTTSLMDGVAKFVQWFREYET